MPRQALDVPAVRLPLEPLADEQPVERAALKIPHLHGRVVGARRVLGVGRAVREVADRRVGVRLELLDAVERRLPVLCDPPTVHRDEPLARVTKLRGVYRVLVRLLRRLEVEREPAPQREHPVVRAANDRVVTRTAFLDWADAPAVGVGAGSARKQLTTSQALRAFGRRLRFTQVAAQRPAVMPGLLEIAFTGAATPGE